MSEYSRILPYLLLSSLLACVLQRRAMVHSCRILGRERHPAIHPMSLAGDVLAGFVGVWFFSLFLIFSSRPLLSVVLTTGLLSLLVFLNQAKEQVLREPLVVADVWLLKQVFRYPGLYVPYLPTVRIVLGLLLLFALIVALWFWERPVVWPTLLRICWGILLLVPLVLLFLLRYGLFSGLKGLLARMPVSHDAVADANRNGTLSSALMHVVKGADMACHNPEFLSPQQRPAASTWPVPFELLLTELANMDTADRPHVALIQAESFYDVRQALPLAKQQELADFLPVWDRMIREGRTLPTPQNAFGAYTMRTEFTVLTGLDGRTLGPWYFNPYLLAASRPLWSLARFFTSLGYDTLCVHPYAGDFFQRDRVMPHLGFFRFLAGEDFSQLPHFGPHVSDLALAERIIQFMNCSAKRHRPLFCFAITMEAHGPWFPGRLSEEQRMAHLPLAARQGFSLPQQNYLCHLKRMDTMFGLLDSYQPDSQGRSARVFGYGDHAPALRFG